MAQRQSIDIPGMAHNAPIPNGCKIGNMVFSSGLMGKDPETGEMPADIDGQVTIMFDNIRRFMQAVGGSPDNIAHVTVFLQDDNHRSAVNKEWNKMFPNEHSRPARHSLQFPLRGGYLVQVELIAVL